MPESTPAARVRLITCPPDFAPPKSASEYSDWGDIDPRSANSEMERWLIVFDDAGDDVVVGDMTAMPIWFGATRGSMAISIGIDVVPQHRGQGIGTQAQRLLAGLIHDRGITRVQASTDVTNIPEQRALAKAGFTFEGVMRGAQVRASGRHDLQVWSHLQGEGWSEGFYPVH